MDLLAAVSESYRARLRALAQAQGLGPDDANDAVQEAFSRFLELGAARRVSTLDETRAYLAVVVTNAARNMRRRHHRRKAHVTFDPTFSLADPNPLPDEQLDAEARLSKLRACIDTLEEVPRRVVSLRVIGELSGSEVAKSLDLTPNHVAVVLHRAKKDLFRCVVCP